MFSLNFSSAGKGPFMDGKAKNMYFSPGGGGGGGSGVRDMDLLSLGNFFIPIFSDLFCANLLSCCVVVVVLTTN